MIAANNELPRCARSATAVLECGKAGGIRTRQRDGDRSSAHAVEECHQLRHGGHLGQVAGGNNRAINTHHQTGDDQRPLAGVSIMTNVAATAMVMPAARLGSSLKKKKKSDCIWGRAHQPVDEE